MKIIELDQWHRKEQFLFFKNYAQPFFNICFDVDVTKLRAFCKNHELSFFLASLYLSLKASNMIENLRYRIVDEKVVCFEHNNCGSTILNKDNTFGFCYFNYADTFGSFLPHAKSALALYHEKASMDVDLSPNMIYYSVIPWISFTSFEHARSGDVNDSVPRIVLGKYRLQENRYLMPLSIEAHHALVDGYHVGQFSQILQELADDPEKNLLPH